uniref:Uncharacterized protein n=1 Tax=Tanacetum cinerariifolium TaxID=118510 RepID=A0A6L2KZC4_TANCI|nr:hypothetical protein [Tanacetum cinerariifolium]
MRPIYDLEFDDESIDTPLVSPFPHSDNDSDDEEVLNELSEYENAGTLRQERIINSFDGDDLAFQCMIGFRKFIAYLGPFLPMNIISLPGRQGGPQFEVSARKKDAGYRLCLNVTPKAEATPVVVAPVKSGKVIRKAASSYARQSGFLTRITLLLIHQALVKHRFSHKLFNSYFRLGFTDSNVNSTSSHGTTWNSIKRARDVGTASSPQNGSLKYLAGIRKGKRFSMDEMDIELAQLKLQIKLKDERTLTQLETMRNELEKICDKENEAHVEIALLKAELHKGRSKRAVVEAAELKAKGEKNAAYFGLQ